MKMRFFSFIVVLCFAYRSSAQEGGKELDPVTVSASLAQQTSSKTGRNIILIKGDEFARLPVHSVDELLRYLPGIEVQQRGPMGSQSDIVIRGATFQQVLVILDGLRLNDPITGHFSSYIPIAPQEIERIEILKGASSAIYGSEAVGGVLNIITKSFAARKETTQNSGLLSSGAGEYKLWNLNAGGSHQKGNTAVAGGLLVNTSDGQLQRGTRGFFHNKTASVSAKQFMGRYTSIAFRSAADIRDFGAQNFYTAFVSDTATEKVNTWWNQLQVQHQKGNHTWRVDAGYKTAKDHYAYNPVSTANENHSYLFQILATDQYAFNSDNNLVGGVQYQRKWIRSNDRGNHVISQAAAFLAGNLSLGDLHISPSLRADHTDNSGTEWVPQINVSWRIQQLLVRASAGKSIREADFTERYNNYNKTFVSGGSIGNPNLEAERSNSYEAGFDYFLRNSSLKISATLFRREGRNVIDWKPTAYAEMPRKVNLSPGGTYALASNVASVNVNGLETDVQYLKQMQSGGRIRASAGLTWLDSHVSEGTPSFYLTSHAKLVTNLNAEYSRSFFAVSAGAIYKYRQPQNAAAIHAVVDRDYFLLNARGSVYLFRRRLSVFTQVDNVLDRRVSDLLGTLVPGRWWTAGVVVQVR